MTRARRGWALVNARGQIFRVVFGRYLAREEAKAYLGARVVPVTVTPR